MTMRQDKTPARRRAARTTALGLGMALLGGFAQAQATHDPAALSTDMPTIVQTRPDGTRQVRRLLSPAQVQEATEASEALRRDPAHRAPDLPGSRAAVTLRPGGPTGRPGAAPLLIPRPQDAPDAARPDTVTAAEATAGAVGGLTLPVTVNITGLPLNIFAPYQWVTVTVTSSDTAAIPSTAQSCLSVFGTVNTAIVVPTRSVSYAQWVWLTIACDGQSSGLWVLVRPNASDNTSWQTGIRDQGNRGTCTYFGATAAVEAMYKRWGQTLDLSEQNLTWLRDVTLQTAQPTATDFENQVGSLSGGGGTYNVSLMSRYGICPEADCPYICDVSPGNADPNYENYAVDPIYAAAGLSGYQWNVQAPLQRNINAWNFAPTQFPQAARRDSVYGVGGYVVLSAAQRADVNYVEQTLAEGYDVLVGLTLDDNRGTASVPVWQPTGGVDGGHCVLLVGYDHARHFFVVKNSWGYNTINAAALAPGWTDVARYNGYTLFDESYLANVTDAGYVTYPSATNTTYHNVQQAMGRWQLVFYRKGTGQVVGGGTLSLRHLPATAGAGGAVDRIGDYVDSTTGADYRVNGVVGAAASAGSFPLSLYINFGTPGVTPGDTSGYQFYGALDASVGAAWPGIYGSGVTSNRSFFGISLDPYIDLDGVPLSDLDFWAYHL